MSSYCIECLRFQCSKFHDPISVSQFDSMIISHASYLHINLTVLIFSNKCNYCRSSVVEKFKFPPTFELGLIESVMFFPILVTWAER